MRSVITALITFVPLVASGDEWVIRAARVETPPVVDGVWEDVWSQGTPAAGFRQFRPDFGEAADADTEVYVLYDDYALYVGWICREPDVEHLAASAGVHDMFLNNDDCVDLMIDTDNDRNTCYDFMVNYRGVRYEGTGYYDGTEWSSSWDGYWEARTSVGDDAWYAEMAIPWSSIRYDRDASSFGVQFTRYRIQNYENTFWSGDDNHVSRVSTFGRVEGFEDLPGPRPFKFTPYATARAEDRNDTPGLSLEPTDGWEFTPRAGFDFQYRAGSAASALVTVLPDYAYVEADPAQLSLEPTEIYFVEKRPFFAENAELFATGFNLVYTRRLTEIAGGAKVLGRAGRFSYCVLDALLKDDDPRYPSDNFYAVRARADVAGGSNVGIMGVGRRELGDVVEDGPYAGGDAARYNNVAAVDGRLALPAGFNVNADVAKSRTPGEGGDGHAYGGYVTYPGSTQFFYTWWREFDDEFRDDAGFIQPEQLGTRQFGFSGLKEFQINRGGLRAFVTSARFEHDWNLAGETLRNFFVPEVRLVGTNKLALSVSSYGGRDLRYVRFGYAAFRVRTAGVTLQHETASWGRARVSYWQGDYYGEYYHDYSGEVTLIPTPPLVLKCDAEVAAPRGGDRSVAGNVNATYNFSENLYARLEVRADSAARAGLASVLWGWTFRPGSTSYLAYEQRRDAMGHFLLAEQVVFLKVSYMLGF
jgi:hypothetical protein